MFVLIKTNDFFMPDNIEGRIQTEIYETYNQAYEVMQSEVIECLKNHDSRYDSYIDNVLEHIEYTNVCLGEWSAREHTAYGKVNRYWKIVEVVK